MVKYTHLECIEYTSRIIKSVDGKLHNVLTGSDISIKIDAVPHFADRIYNRHIQLEKLVKLLTDVVTTHVCELLYAINLPNSRTRIGVASTNLFVGATINPRRNRITLRTLYPIDDNDHIHGYYIMNTTKGLSCTY
jgi:hypothetical protein